MGKKEHFLKPGLLVSFAEIGNKRLGSLAGCLCVYGLKKNMEEAFTSQRNCDEVGLWGLP